MFYLNDKDTSGYHSSSQKIRILTESWFLKSAFCPSCGTSLEQTKNNSKACDFICSECKEQFELKSKNGSIGKKIINGAYASLIARLNSHNNPNLCVLQYNRDYSVENCFVVPKYFFTESTIEKRKPLSQTARRAGWVGCNILIGQIPDFGRIHYIKNSLKIARNEIIKSWKNTTFIKDRPDNAKKGWLLDTITCIEKIESKEFSLDELYKFENFLKINHPNNRHIKEKLRQQLQILRDNGYLEFLSRGKYKVIS